MGLADGTACPAPLKPGRDIVPLYLYRDKDETGVRSRSRARPRPILRLEAKELEQAVQQY